MSPETIIHNANAPEAASKKRFSLKKIALVLALLLLVYGAYDLFAPRSSRLRSFDSHEVARLETAMWRSYYSNNRGRLVNLT